MSNSIEKTKLDFNQKERVSNDSKSPILTAISTSPDTSESDMKVHSEEGGSVYKTLLAIGELPVKAINGFFGALGGGFMGLFSGIGVGAYEGWKAGSSGQPPILKSLGGLSLCIIGAIGGGIGICMVGIEEGAKSGATGLPNLLNKSLEEYFKYLNEN